MTTLAIIPARGGSKGVRGKNMLALNGKTLIQLAVECARASGVCDRIVVNSDSGEIIDHANQIGCETLRRPECLGSDHTPTEHVVMQTLWCCQERGVYDGVFVLQPTTPQRTPEQLREAWKLFCEPWRPSGSVFIDGKPDSVVSVQRNKCPPQKAMVLENGELRHYDDKRITQRQQCVQSCERNGAVYLVRGSLAQQGELYGSKVVPLVTRPMVSIDTEDDWKEVQRLFKEANDAKEAATPQMQGV